MKPKPVSDEILRVIEEIIVPSEKWEQILKYYKMEHYKISKLLNDSVVLKFVTRKWIEENCLSGDQYSVNKDVKFKTQMLR